MGKFRLKGVFFYLTCFNKFYLWTDRVNHKYWSIRNVIAVCSYFIKNFALLNPYAYSRMPLTVHGMPTLTFQKVYNFIEMPTTKPHLKVHVYNTQLNLALSACALSAILSILFSLSLSTNSLLSVDQFHTLRLQYQCWIKTFMNFIILVYIDPSLEHCEVYCINTGIHTFSSTVTAKIFSIMFMNTMTEINHICILSHIDTIGNAWFCSFTAYYFLNNPLPPSEIHNAHTLYIYLHSELCTVPLLLDFYLPMLPVCKKELQVFSQ